ncbi:toll/interleukin-1 receptor domain-containing protein [Pilimelia anulata]|nr:toll/interleukin-1 receptor domain-containing protein [Pilimelia anulata]
MSGRRRVFVSYSRHQFHAAEHLAAVLAAAGHDVWLDVQRLGPGDDWAAAIEAGVDAADAVVLLASPAALASPYVGAEWRRALRRGTPVVVALAATTALPAALRGAPVLDLRRRFAAGAAAVARLVGGDAAAAAPPGRLGVPLPVAWLTATLALGMAATAGSLLLYAVELARLPERGGVPDPLTAGRLLVAPVVAGAFLAYQRGVLRRFRARAATRGALLAAVLLGVPGYQAAADLLNAVMFAAQHGVESNVELERTPSELTVAFFVIATLVLVPAHLAALGCLLLSRSVLYWLPVGDPPRRLRRRVLGPAAPRPDGTTRPGGTERPDAAPQRPSGGTGRRDAAAGRQDRAAGRRDAAAGERGRAGGGTVRVDHADADAGVAAAIGRACAAAGLAVTDGPADRRLVVISAHTSWPRAAAALRAGPAVAVLVASVRPPAAAAELQRFQWVDARDGDLAALPGRLAAGAADPWAIDRFTAPRAVRRVLAALLVLAAVLGASAALSTTVVAGRVADRTVDHSVFRPGGPVRREVGPHADVLLRVRAGLAGALSLLCLGTAWLLGRRRLTAGGLGGLALAGGLGLIVWIMLGMASREPPTRLLAGYALATLAGLAWLATYGNRVVAWLPTAPAPRRGTAGDLLPAVGAPLLHPAFPLALTILTPLHIAGLLF